MTQARSGTRRPSTEPPITDPEPCAECGERRVVMMAMAGPRGATWWLCGRCWAG